MKHVYWAAFLCIIFATRSLPANDRPNIIFVLADDLGWTELGCYGNAFNETPNLDQLARQGMRFTQAYAAAPVCSPYRAALLTGQHPARVGIIDYLRPNSANALSISHVTLAEVLKKHGYATGMAGKWHLTGYRYHDAEFEVVPGDHGFDWNFGREVKGVGNGANTWPYVFRTQPIRWLDIPENRLGEKEYLTDRLNLEAVDFVERNKDKPFFLFLSHYAPHTILNGRADLVQKYVQKHAPGKSTRDKCYLCQDAGLTGDAGHHWAGDHNPHLAAMLEGIDNGVGLLMRKLEQLGIADNTIVVFSSDNGGETNVTSNAPLRGGKSQLYEGGIRVPMIVRWPDNVPAGTVCSLPTINTDVYPTLLDAAGIPHPPDHEIDGRSMLPTWRKPEQATGRDALHWHYPLDAPHFLGGVSAGAIRAGDWKLIEYFDRGHDPQVELFNLKDDVSESGNVAANHPERVEKLKTQLAVWRKEKGARVPSAPILVSPRSLYFGDHFSEGLVSDRWHFQEQWAAADGVLQRTELPGTNQRIFVKDPVYKDVMIRFDFRFNGAKDIRLVTGSSGHYNAVLHIHPDHFYLQTASDDRGPWFSRRHGECAFDFKKGQWYSMTVEFAEDQLVAHLDSEHLVYAKHPILDVDRTYFAFQVDQPAAKFDNVQIFHAKKTSNAESQLAYIESKRGKYPVKKSPEEQYRIRKANAHDRFYQNDERYRALVKNVADMKAQEKVRYPEVFASVKEVRKKIDAERRRLHQEDPAYKETLFATFKAKRALDVFVIERHPEIDKLPKSKRSATLELFRRKHLNDPGYVRLVAASEQTQKKLEADYPQLFVSNEVITQQRKEHRQALQGDSEFRAMIGETAAAWRAQQDYLHENDQLLKELKVAVEKRKKSASDEDRSL